MPLKFRLLKTRDMRKEAAEGAKVVVPQLVSNGRVEFEELCEEVAEQSSLTSGDVKNAVDRLVYCISAHLRNGQSVSAGDLGSFRVTIRSQVASTEEEYDAATLMRPQKVVFSPGKKLRDIRDDAKYERVKPAEAECDKEHVEDNDGPIEVT